MTIGELDEATSPSERDLRVGWYVELPEGSLAPYRNERNLQATLGVVDRMAYLSRQDAGTDESPEG